MIGWEKRNTCMLLFDTFLYFNTKLIIQYFQAVFHPCYNSCICIKKQCTSISNTNRTPRLTPFPPLKATLLHFSGICPTAFFETKSSHITATAFLSFSICSSRSQFNTSSPVMEIHTSL